MSARSQRALSGWETFRKPRGRQPRTREERIEREAKRLMELFAEDPQLMWAAARSLAALLVDLSPR